MTERLIILRENEKLLNIAKEIFGDVVENAYFEQSHYGDSDEIPEYALRNLGYAETNIEASQFDDSYDLDNGPIIIKFKNGKCVEFSCSEWGSIVLISSTGMDDIRTIVV